MVPAVVRALASHQCDPGSIPGLVVGSRPCHERFFSGYFCFPLSQKTNISKFHFDLESVPISALKESDLLITNIIFCRANGLLTTTKRLDFVIPRFSLLIDQKY